MVFDVVMDELIFDKGWVLIVMIVFWFEWFIDVVVGYLLFIEFFGLIEGFGGLLLVEMVGRIVVCWWVEMFFVECIVRGYIIGLVWKEY